MSLSRSADASHPRYLVLLLYRKLSSVRRTGRWHSPVYEKSSTGCNDVHAATASGKSCELGLDHLGVYSFNDPLTTVLSRPICVRHTERTRSGSVGLECVLKLFMSIVPEAHGSYPAAAGRQ